MRLAVVMRQPLGVVMDWPAAHVDLLLAFMAKEPPPETRIELGIGQLTQLAYNRTRGRDAKPLDLADFLMFGAPWGAPVDEPSALDAQVMSRIDAIGRKTKE